MIIEKVIIIFRHILPPHCRNISIMAGLVQYVLVRSDLKSTWPLGAVIAQACHACTAIIYQFRNDEHVINYTSDMDNMHKCVLEVKTLLPYS